MKEHEQLQRSFADHMIKQNDWNCTEVNRETFWIVTRCNTGVTNAIADRCHNPVCNDTLSSVPVTDTNGITYRNVYCAVCHNVDVSNLTAWKVEANCDPDMGILLEDANSAPNMDIICSSCKLSTSIPQTLIDDPIATRRCVPNVISECNVTGLGGQDSEDHQVACDSYTAMINVAGTLYRNPHCFMCNYEGINFENKTIQCTGNTVPRLIDKFLVQNTKESSPGVDKTKNGKNSQGPSSFNPSINAVPLSIILDFGSSESSSLRIYHERKVIKETLMSCPNGQVYAELPNGKGECLTLSCSSGTRYINGNCVPIHASTLEDTNDIEWCGSTSSNRLITLSAEFTSPFSSCQNQSFIAMKTECLLQALQLMDTIRSCTQVQNNVTEMLVGIDKDSFHNMQHTLDRLYSSRQISGTSEISICGSSHLRLIQTCLDHSDMHSCQSEWLSTDDVNVKYSNDTNHIYYNHNNSSSTLHGEVISRDVYTITPSGARKQSHVKLCIALPGLTCPLLTLNSSLFYTLEDDNQTIIYIPDGRQFSSGDYFRTSDGHIKVCNFLDQWSLMNETRYESFFTYSKIQTLLSMTGTIISMVAAAATFLTFAVFSSLRNTTSRLIMNLIVALFTGQLLLLVSGRASYNDTACFAVAVASHYVWLVVFASMNALAFDLDRTFGNSDNLQSLGNSKKRTSMYILYSWGSPLLVIAPCVFIHHCQCTSRMTLRYGDHDICWIGDGIANLTMFATPAATLLVVNLLLYVHTVTEIWATKRATSKVYADGAAMKRVVKELGIYVKVSPNSLLNFHSHHV